MNNEDIIELKIKETEDLLNLLRVASYLTLMRNITFYKSETDGHKFSMYTMNQRPMKLEDIGKTRKITNINHDCGPHLIDSLRIIWTDEENPIFEYYNNVLPISEHYIKSNTKNYWKMTSKK